MIASGGLSGGVSSAIAGGKFWKGVRQGLITSGLNHGNRIKDVFEYSIYKNKICKHLFENQVFKFNLKSVKVITTRLI